MYDLSSANKNIQQKPKWYKSYSFKTEYGLPDLTPGSLNKWLRAAAKDENLLDKYYK